MCCIDLSTWQRTRIVYTEEFAAQRQLQHTQPNTPWWRHQMETFSALLALCVGNSPVTGEFPSQRPVTRSFGVFFGLSLNQRLSKNREAGDLRRPRAHYDVTGMKALCEGCCKCGVMTNSFVQNNHITVSWRMDVYLWLILSANCWCHIIFVFGRSYDSLNHCLFLKWQPGVANYLLLFL